MSDTLDLAADLIALPSVTPDDHGCQEILAQRLRAMGFAIESLRYGEVDNLWARRGQDAPLFVFAGHTDVVPPGPLDDWQSNPFRPVVRDGYLYGRGAADMKGSIAAMITACERFTALQPEHRGSIAFLLTSDEEGPAVDGTSKVIQHLQSRGEKIDWCLVGEPTSNEKIGDVIKNGRRGSLSGVLTIIGVQGHVAYPQLADNPIHRAAPALAALCTEHWDDGNEFFPPTTFQISNVHAGTGVENVIPGELRVHFNFRYATASDHQQLQQRVTALLDAYDLRYRLDWNHSGFPYLTEPAELVNATHTAVRTVTGRAPELSTTGGTSDGRFIAPTGAQVVELGPVNATIHKVDERVRVDELETLSVLYEHILGTLLA